MQYREWTPRLSLLPAKAKSARAALVAIIKASSFDPYLDLGSEAGDRENSQIAAHVSGLFEFIEALDADIDLLQGGEVNGAETIWLCPTIPLGLVEIFGLTDSALDAAIQQAFNTHPEMDHHAEHHGMADSEVVSCNIAVRDWTICLLKRIGQLAPTSRKTNGFCMNVAGEIAVELSGANCRDIYAAIEDTAGEHGILEPALYGSAILRAMGLITANDFGLGISNEIAMEWAGISLALAIATIAGPRSAEDPVEASSALIYADLEIAALKISQHGVDSPKVNSFRQVVALPPNAIISAAEDLANRMNGDGVTDEAMHAARRMQALVHGDIETATPAAVSEAAEKFVASNQSSIAIINEALGQLLDNASFAASFVASAGGVPPSSSPKMKKIEKALTDALRRLDPDAPPITIQARAWLMAERSERRRRRL
ncbi:hypothetical protein [Roseovarius sp. D0-M9]|uniref:hypothetical protein n=1 Tax=Roseovarius sp. D0-M9 TaxID=3127117 RepID=UPI00300FD73F